MIMYFTKQLKLKTQETHTHLLTKMFIYIIFKNKNKKQNKINKLNKHVFKF